MNKFYSLNLQSYRLRMCIFTSISSCYLMSYFSLSLSPARSTTTPRHIVLDNWMKAVTTFQENYHQLNQYVPCEPARRHSNRFIGQCSTSQISQLVDKMNAELETLVTEMNSPLSLPRLKNHTARLTLLTNQASVIINLLTQSSC